MASHDAGAGKTASTTSGSTDGRTKVASLNTPLAAVHVAAGAQMGVWLGCALPDDFGDASAEYRYAPEPAAPIAPNYPPNLSFTRPDRVRYPTPLLPTHTKHSSPHP